MEQHKGFTLPFKRLHSFEGLVAMAGVVVETGAHGPNGPVRGIMNESPPVWTEGARSLGPLLMKISALN